MYIVCVSECVPVIIKEKGYKFENRVIGQTRERKEKRECYDYILIKMS